MMPPTSTTPNPIPTPMRTSTKGCRAPEYRLASRLAFRCSLLRSSKCSMLASCRLKLSTTRTPVMFWLYSPLTMAMARRMRMKECLANLCQYPNTKKSTGRMLMLIKASRQSIHSIIATIPTRLSMSERLCTISSKVSWSWRTSLWLRDMMRPTGVRWKKDGESSCRWLNIPVRSE